MLDGRFFYKNELRLVFVIDFYIKNREFGSINLRVGGIS